MANAKLCFSIYGDTFNLDDLSSIVKVAPTSSYRKGDKLHHISRQETAWEYSLEARCVLSLDKQFAHLTEILCNCMEELLNYVQKYSLKAKLDIVISNLKDGVPGLFLTSEFLDLLHRLHCEIDIDLYCE